jgi:hypothetical protein
MIINLKYNKAFINLITVISEKIYTIKLDMTHYGKIKLLKEKKKYLSNGKK